jgi:hypothetical protein
MVESMVVGEAVGDALGGAVGEAVGLVAGEVQDIRMLVISIKKIIIVIQRFMCIILSLQQHTFFGTCYR